MVVCLQEEGISPKSENGGADSGGESSGNESPSVDHEAAGTPDPRGRETHIQLSGVLAPVSNKATPACATPCARSGPCKVQMRKCSETVYVVLTRVTLCNLSKRQIYVYLIAC